MTTDKSVGTNSNAVVDILENGSTSEILRLLRSGFLYDFNQYDRESFIEECARLGKHEKVERLLVSELALNYAVKGYALVGNPDKVKELLQQGADINYAVFGYARGLYTAEVETLLSQGAEPAVALYGYHNFLNQEDALIILALTNDDNIRKNLAELAGEKGYLPNYASILNKAIRLNDFIKQYKLDFAEAKLWYKVLSKAELRTWFLQGRQLVVDRKLTPDIFFTIAAMVTETDKNKISTIFSAYMQHMTNLCEKAMVEKIEEQFESKNRLFNKSIFLKQDPVSSLKNEILPQEKTKQIAEVNEIYKNRFTFKVRPV